MTTALPRVSVCLLTYNQASVLPRSIESLLSQSHGDFELIINDDCSTDGTEELCRSYAVRDHRVRYFKNRTNLTFSGNQNAAILRAQSEYVGLVHQGDIYRRDLLEQWTRALVTYPSAALVFNASDHLDHDGRILHHYRNPYGPLLRGLDLFDDMLRRPHSPIFGIVMVRRRCVWEAGPFDPRLSVLADVDMWLRLLLRHDAAYIDEPLFQASPRERGTPINASNWRIRRQHELIYLLNSARRYPNAPKDIQKLRLAISPMLWRVRLRSLAYCIWHGRWAAAAEGAALAVRHPRFASEVLPDRVLNWADARALLEALPAR